MIFIFVARAFGREKRVREKDEDKENFISIFIFQPQRIVF